MPAAPPPPLLTRAFGLLIAAHFLESLGFASMLLLPLYLEHLGASRTEIGTLMGISAAGGLLLRPVIGWSLDRWGRKPTVMIGTVFLVAGMLLVAPVDRIGPLIYVERIVFGIGIGTTFTAYFTFAADLVPVARRTEGIALFGISGLLPLLINPLADQLHIEPADLRWFLPAVGLCILPSLAALARLREPAAGGADRPPMAGVFVALRHPSLWPVWLASFSFSGLVAVFMAFATVTAERRGIDRPATLWLSYALGAVTVRLLGARLPDRVGPANVVAPALGLYVVAALLVAKAGTLPAFLVAGLLAGLGHGYCFPVLTSQAVTRVPDTFRGSAVAVFTALWGTSELLVAPAFGAIGDAHGDAAMFLCAALGGIVSLVAWLGLEHRHGPQPGFRPGRARP